MYAGRLAETGPVDPVRPADPPLHGRAVGLDPSLDSAANRRLTPIDGTTPSMLAPPPGCAFAPRCDWSTDACTHEVPDLKAVGEHGQSSACIRTEEFQARTEPAMAVEAQLEPLDRAFPRHPQYTPDDSALLKVTELFKDFPIRAKGLRRKVVGTVQAVNGVSLHIDKGRHWGWWVSPARESPPWPAAFSGSQSHIGNGGFRRGGSDLTGPAADAESAPRYADRLPRSNGLPRPPHDGLGHHRRAPPHPPHDRRHPGPGGPTCWSWSA